jgi:hypothetical protein
MKEKEEKGEKRMKSDLLQLFSADKRSFWS